MLSAARLLIIEGEALIALDIQRVVEGAHALETVFARTYAQAADLTHRFGEFNLAIITPPRPQSVDWIVAERLVAGGAAIVVCAAMQVDLSRTSLKDAQLIYKPFSDEALLAACRRALKSDPPAA